MTSYSTRKKLTFTLTARPVTMTWTQSWAFSVICTYTIVQTWITVAWIHWNNKILYTNSWCSKSNTIHIYTCITITLFLLRSSCVRQEIIPTTFQCLTQARTWISNVICHDLFCVQWFEVRDCSFCWYLWSCWLSFHKSNTTGATSVAEVSSYPSGAPQPIFCLGCSCCPIFSAVVLSVLYFWFCKLFLQ